MMTLITAAVAAAQPVPATPQAQPIPMQHGQMAPMQHPQHHEAMKEGCPCCKNMGKGEHDMRAPGARPQGRRGQ